MSETLTDTTLHVLPEKGRELGEHLAYCPSRVEEAIDAFARQAVDEALATREETLEDLRRKLDFYKRRCDLLQSWQARMRDPERTIVCDILANAQTLPDSRGHRYGQHNLEVVARARHELNTHGNALRAYIDSLSGEAFQGVIRALSALRDIAEAAGVAHLPAEHDVDAVLRYLFTSKDELREAMGGWYWASSTANGSKATFYTSPRAAILAAMATAGMPTIPGEPT